MYDKLRILNSCTETAPVCAVALQISSVEYCYSKEPEIYNIYIYIGVTATKE